MMMTLRHEGWLVLSGPERLRPIASRDDDPVEFLVAGAIASHWDTIVCRFLIGLSEVHWDTTVGRFLIGLSDCGTMRHRIGWC